MRVLSYDECAGRAGIVRRTLERQIADGMGPPIVEVSTRRRGVIETDFEAWLLSRRRPTLAVPEFVAPTGRRGRPRKTLAAPTMTEPTQSSALP
jgi:hypothetical protein